jgi:hypothetical protein
MSRSTGAKGSGKSPETIKEEILVELRNIVHYRESLSRATDRLDYEEKHKEILAFAGAVYHFRERLRAWFKKSKITIAPTIDEIAEKSVPLLVCGDLFNAKKHSGNESRSGHRPTLSELSFKAPGGPIGIFFDGVSKTGELTRPVGYSIEIRTDNGESLGSAVDYISKAFGVWTSIVEQNGLLSNEVNVEKYVLQKLKEF